MASTPAQKQEEIPHSEAAGYYSEWKEDLPRALGKIDLQIKAEELGIETFLVTSSSLQIDQRSLWIPRSNIRNVQQNGVGFHGHFDYAFHGVDPECYFVPNPETLIQLPWKPEVGWLASFVYNDGKAVEGCARRTLIRQLNRAYKMGYTFKTGIEPEFILLKKDSLEELIMDECSLFNSNATIDQHRLLSRIMKCMDKLGWGPQKAGHETSKNQYEVTFDYADALVTADRWCFVKFMVQSLAKEEGLRATFMPFLGNEDGRLKLGTGMHIHHSLWNVSDDKELFPDDQGHLGLSDIGRHFLAGEMRHLQNQAIFYCPSVNSYKRFQLHNVYNVISYGVNSRWVAVRIVTANGKTNRLELRCGDASANPYLAHAALLASGLDGIQKKMELNPEQELRDEIPFLPPLEMSGHKVLPTNLGDAIKLLSEDEFTKETLGHDVVNKLLAVKKEMWDDFNRFVSAWEKVLVDAY